MYRSVYSRRLQINLKGGDLKRDFCVGSTAPALRHECTCLKRRGVIVQSLERLGVEVTDLEIGDGLTTPKSLLRLFKFAQHLRKEETSVLHCYLPRASFFGAIAGRIARVPAVLVSKRSLERQESLKQVFLCRVAHAWADMVLANSRAGLSHAVEVGRCRPDKLSLLVNGIDIERYKNTSINGLSHQGTSGWDCAAPRSHQGSRNADCSCRPYCGRGARHPALW